MFFKSFNRFFRRRLFLNVFSRVLVAQVIPYLIQIQLILSNLLVKFKGILKAGKAYQLMDCGDIVLYSPLLEFPF